MEKLFLFGIGGTGARVIKHLVFLAAAGVKFNSDADTIVPIIIDPDNENGDLNKTLKLIKIYSRIQNNVEQNTNNGFFKLKFRNIETLTGDIGRYTREEDNFHQTIQDIQNKNLKDFLNLNTMTESSEALLRLLFSEDNLETNLEVGFKGNPNIGSVVLNQFSDAEYFKSFASSFNSGDRIFVISSIFGGTGASGFPILLKNLRNPDEKIPNHNYIKDAIIGAVSVLPYFNIENKESSKINSNTFISKTKSALEYYYNNIITTKHLNSIYYIGYNKGDTYENSEGGKTQENKAHFIEFASALSIIDFMDTSFTNEEVSTKEYATNSFDTYLTLTCLSHKDRKKIQNELIQFFLMTRYFTDKLPTIPKNTKLPWFNETKINTTDPAYQDMKEFIELYYQYLREMANNNVAFKPFKIDEENKEEVFSSIESITPYKSSMLLNIISSTPKKDYDFFDHILNKSSKELPKDISNFKRLISLMYRATAQIIQDKQLDYKG